MHNTGFVVWRHTQLFNNKIIVVAGVSVAWRKLPFATRNQSSKKKKTKGINLNAYLILLTCKHKYLVFCESGLVFTLALEKKIYIEI